MSYQFDKGDATKRLEATKKAMELIEEAHKVLIDAGVRNGRVRNALTTASYALAKYKGSTKYAISKRRERIKGCRPSIS